MGTLKPQSHGPYSNTVIGIGAEPTGAMGHLPRVRVMVRVTVRHSLITSDDTVLKSFISVLFIVNSNDIF